MDREHRRAAAKLKEYLDRGENIVYLTLGDPTVYCTFSYIQRYLERDGYAVELVSGVPSFCAAAARLGIPLTEWDEPLHILPAVHMSEDALQSSGNYVLMKPASRMKQIKEQLRQSGLEIHMVENCGMDNEKLYHRPEEIPDDAGYFSLIIARERRADGFGADPD